MSGANVETAVGQNLQQAQRPHPVRVQETIPNWLVNLSVLWERRRLLARTSGIALATSLLIAFLLPKRYESTARIMPPDNQSGNSAMIAALAGHSLDGIGGLLASLLGGRTNSALFENLLRSGTVTGDIVDRFDLQQVYANRYRVDAMKKLVRRTTIEDDKKSGVITLTVSDTSPQRARDLAQGYLDELNLLVIRTNTSSAHQERVFIEQRLRTVHSELEQAQQAMSDFSSSHAAVDIREQTRALVDAGAKLQGELIATKSQLDSMRQIYGEENVRIRATRARVAELQSELEKLGGSSAPLPGDPTAAGDSALGGSTEVLYPPLRQLPRLAVPYADLSRKVRIAETVYEFLTQQYEAARIQEAKDIPVVNVIDAPAVPEKKSFPPRLLLSLALTAVVVCIMSAALVFSQHWKAISAADPRRIFLAEVSETVHDALARWTGRGALR